jgi:hypothetical protein
MVVQAGFGVPGIQRSLGFQAYLAGAMHGAGLTKQLGPIYDSSCCWQSIADIRIILGCPPRVDHCWEKRLTANPPSVALTRPRRIFGSVRSDQVAGSETGIALRPAAAGVPMLLTGERARSDWQKHPWQPSTDRASFVRSSRLGARIPAPDVLTWRTQAGRRAGSGFDPRLAVRGGKDWLLVHDCPDSVGISGAWEIATDPCC